MNKLIPAALLFLVQAPLAMAATYYVDAGRGNDVWSGRLADPALASTADGPWQSLARVARTALVAGDTIAMRCGSVWNETLKISASGTAALPISVRPYPSPCTGAGPTVDGFSRTSPTAQWSRQGANLYRLQLPFNLLSNGHFEQGLAPWRVWSPVGDAQLVVTTACGPAGTACLQMKSGSGNEPTVVYGSTFPIIGSGSYRLRFDFKAATGTPLRAYVRRSVAPYDAVGVSATVTGNGAWQSISMPFTGLRQLESARLDFELAQGGTSASVDNLAVERQVVDPFSAMLGPTPLLSAHHPNRGYSATEPTSPFLRAATDADVVPTALGGTGSTYVPTGSDFTLPAGAVLQIGTTIRIRTNAWLIDERKVVGVSGNRLLLDRPTTYPLKAGWGYYLVGAAWMVDEGGEWHLDAPSSSVLVRTATDAAPQVPLALATLDTCVDVAGSQHVIVEGLALSGCRTAVRATATNAVVLRNLRMLDIASNGVFAPGSKSLQLLASRIERAGEHAVLGSAPSLGVATGMLVSGNAVVDAGVARVNGKAVTLPVATLGAVIPGDAASVLNNSISGAGYNGIRTFGGGLVKGNSVESACLVLDDCAGIYAFGVGLGSRIESNVVRDMPGGMDGKPVGSTSQAQGIFLDDHANGFTVIGNTVSEAESGILLHNAFNNTVQGNMLYGNRRHQIWLLEDSNSKSVSGDIYGNVIVDNMLFSTAPNAAVGQQSLIKETTHFASYDRNRYSALISNRVVSESWPSGSGSFQFPGWQSVVSPTGAARYPDLNGSVVNAVGFATFRILGDNIVRNGSMTSGNTDWTPWNDRLPAATAVAASCGSQACLDVTGGASVSLVASPPFSVVAGNWYRVSYDLRSVNPGQSISVLVRRGGGGSNGYESLMGSAEMVTAQPAFQRFSFAFKATKSINAADAFTKDIGARLYFDRIAAGNRVTLANVEIVPVSAADATMQTKLFANPGAVAATAVCPEATSNPAKCSQYIDFANGSRISWPLYIAPKSSVVGYTRDTTLVDSDGDGISDDQDQCPGTAGGAVTNAKGCS